MDGYGGIEAWCCETSSQTEEGLSVDNGDTGTLLRGIDLESWGLQLTFLEVSIFT